MAIIGTTTFLEDGDQNYLEMGNGDQYFRQFSLPANWSLINIGALVAVDATGSLPKSNGLWLGLTTSGQPGVGFKQVSYNNFTAIRRMVGWGAGSIGYAGTYTVSDWIYKSASADFSGSTITPYGGYYYACSGSAAPQSRGGNLGSCFFATTQDTPRKTIIAATFRKINATQYYFTPGWLGIYTGSVSNSNHNHTIDTLVSVLSTGLAYNNYRYVDGVESTMQYPATVILPVQPSDDANFPLDTINLYATGSNKFRIYALVVSVSF